MVIVYGCISLVLKQQQMNYFQNQSKSYNRILKEQCSNISINIKTKANDNEKQTNRSQDKGYNYAQYKLDKPKNAIVLKSIYTENESQFIRMQTNQDEDLGYEYQFGLQEDENEDLYQFIQNSKTLKQKINEKLCKSKKKSKNQKIKIAETTFRPSQVHKPSHKQNTTSASNLTNRKTDRTYRGVEAKNMKTERSKSGMRKILTEVSELNNKWWPSENEPSMVQLSFHQRQQRTLKNKKEQTQKIGSELKKKQMEGCTFQPKLTKYKPKRV